MIDEIADREAGGVVRRKLNGLIITHNMSVRPEDFGAIGDGRTDDTAAIQAALDTGRPVRLGDRPYLISTLIIKKPPKPTSGRVGIIGSGASVLLAKNLDGSAIDVQAPHTTLEGFSLTLLKPKKSDFTRNNAGISIENPTGDIFDIRVAGITITGFTTGISSRRFYFLTIEDCTLYHYNVGLAFGPGENDEGQSYTAYCNRCFLRGSVNEYDPMPGSIGVRASRMTDIQITNTMNEFIGTAASFINCDGVTLISCYSEAWKEFLFNIRACSNVKVDSQRAVNTFHAADFIFAEYSRLIIIGNNYGLVGKSGLVRRGKACHIVMVGPNDYFDETPSDLGQESNVSVSDQSFAIRKETVELTGNFVSAGRRIVKSNTAEPSNGDQGIEVRGGVIDLYPQEGDENTPVSLRPGVDGQMVTLLNRGQGILELRDNQTAGAPRLRLTSPTVEIHPLGSICVRYLADINAWVQIGPAMKVA